jgi:hypothetical protein
MVMLVMSGYIWSQMGWLFIFFLCANQCCFAFLSGYACYERMIHKHPFPSLKNSHVGNWYVITNSHPREFIYTSSFGEQLFMH